MTEHLMTEHYKVNIVDAPCGQGKTTSAINMINDSFTEIANIKYNYIYVTPFLNEVKRIKESCKTRKFKEPSNDKTTKIQHIKKMIEKGDNIVTTHALFRLFDEETIQLAYLNNYILIMDEVADVVEQKAISQNDIETILEKYAIIGENGKLIWTNKEYVGKFEEYKHLCELESLYIYGNENTRMAVLWNFPVSVFKAFQQIYILTYMFDAQLQRYYFDLHNVEYNYLYVKKINNKHTFTNEYILYPTEQYSSLIHICNNKKLNLIGDLDYTFSKTWYIKFKDNTKVMKTIKNNMENYIGNIIKSPSEKNMWTTFKDYQNILKGKGYTKGFVPCNARATNEYKDKNCVIYLINIFLNPVMKNFFTTKGVEVDEDRYATSELIQFLFRSAIRDNKEIYLYIPSLRMRNLLHQWLNEEKERGIIDLSIKNKKRE